MTALLNWRVWFAIGIAASLALMGAGGYRVGSKHVQAEWDAEKVVQLHAAAVAEVENRRIETKRQTGVIDAQNAQVKRTAVLQADAASSRAAVDSLRDTIRTATASLSSRSAASASEYSAALGAVLAECGTAFADVAAKADGHASDSLMLQEAWPK